MRNNFWLPIAGALLLAACKEEVPSRMQRGTVEAQRDAVLGPDGRAAVPIEAARETAKRVQRDDKLPNAAQEAKNEQAQAAQQKSDSVRAEAETKDGAAATQTVVGTVAKASDGEVEVAGASPPALKLAIDPSTSIRFEGRDIRASQIAEGSQVRASYRPVDGKLTALRLDVTPGAKKADDKK